jgi:hypothetical protein
MQIHQLLLVAMFLGSYLVLALIIHPWQSPATGRMQVSALLVLVVSCIAIIAWGVDDSTRNYSDLSYKNALPWLVIALNLCYVVVAVVSLVICAWREYRIWRATKKQRRF